MAVESFAIIAHPSTCMHAEQDCIALELIYSGGAGQQTMAGLSVCVYVVAAAEPETTFNYDNEL